MHGLALVFPILKMLEINTEWRLRTFFVANFQDNTVLDMYRPQANEGPPCQDSKCDPVGTDDLFNTSISRANGISTFSFSRKLNTGDKNDWPIVQGNNPVLFAHGTTDTFGYHSSNRGLGHMDFYAGTFFPDPGF